MAENIRDLVSKENPRLLYKIIEEGLYDEKGNQIQTPTEGAIVYGQNPGAELIKKVKNGFELMKTGNIQEITFGGDKAKAHDRRYPFKFYLRCIDDPNHPNNAEYLKKEVNSLSDEDKEKIKQLIEELLYLDSESKLSIKEEKFNTASSKLQQRFAIIPTSVDKLEECEVPTNFESIFLSETEASRWYYIKNLREYINTIEDPNKKQEEFDRLMKISEIRGEHAEDVSKQYAEHIKDKGLTSVSAIDSTSYAVRKGSDLQKILNDSGIDCLVIFKGVNFFPERINPNNYDEVIAYNPKWPIIYEGEAQGIAKHMRDSEISELNDICEREEQEATDRQSGEYDDGSK